MEILNMLLTEKSNRPGTLITFKYLVVHWTANEGIGANAISNRNYFNTRRLIPNSAHYCVDSVRIVRCIPEREVAYAVGSRIYTDWCRKNIGSYPNNKTISIEMCVNKDGDFWKMYSKTVHLCADILKRHGVGVDRLIRHHDVTGKNCPAFFVSDVVARQYMGRNAKDAWIMFKADVKRVMLEG